MYKFVWGKKSDPVFNDCFKIREEVFMAEQGFTDEADDLDEAALHMVIYSEDGTPLATGRTVAEGEGIYRPGRVAVKKSLRGTGLGRIVMQEIEKKCIELSATELIIGAQAYAEDFYKGLGYARNGEDYYEEHCLHIPMNKILVKE